MTDKEKLDKLVAEIERLIGDYNIKTEKYRGMNEQAHQYYGGKRDALSEILKSIVSMQEESINNGLDLGCGVIWKEEESASEDFKITLEKKVREAQDWTYIEEEGGECPLNEEFGAYDLEEFARWGAKWQKEQMMKDAVDGTVFTQLEDGVIMVHSHYFKSEKIKYLDEVKLIIIKVE